MALTTASIRQSIIKIHAQIEVLGAELNELDARLGDGDLGVTLINGFNNLAEHSDELPDDVGMALFQCAKLMTRASGSSFGTLMATALMAAGKKIKGTFEIAPAQISELLIEAQQAMISRGGASLGDKTLLDSVDAVILAIENNTSIEEILENAHAAAEKALQSFNDRPNKIGRARIFGDRTIGMDDPGMVAISRLIACLK